MRANETSKIDELLDLPEQLNLSCIEEHLSQYLERKADKKLALQELDTLIGKLHNHILLLSLYIKQNHLIERKSATESAIGFYTKQEVAILYRVSVRTVTNWIISGLETTLIGGVIRISKQAVEEFVRHNKTKKFNWRSIVRKA
jgi:hypothetical protein